MYCTSLWLNFFVLLHNILSSLHIICVNFSPPQKRFSMLVFTFKVDTSFFVFPWILFYHLVYFLERFTVQVFDTITFSLILPCDVDIFCIRVNYQETGQGISCIIIMSIILLIMGTYSYNSRLWHSTRFVVMLLYVINWSVY